jgi:predicted site-specific integrase-resolvase
MNSADFFCQQSSSSVHFREKSSLKLLLESKSRMESLQAQIESQGAKIRTMKEAIKADPTSHPKEDLDREIKELTSMKVLWCDAVPSSTAP